MLEADFMRQCMRRATDLGARLFRMNIGLAWTGDVTKNRDGSITIRNPRPFKSGVPGMSDLIGWTPVQITAGMVGKTVAIYSAVETKSAKGRPTPEQANFISAVQKAGGLAGIARTDSDLTIILCGPISVAQGVDKIATGCEVRNVNPPRLTST
jgi:hypothetical protein